jgi:hypothetical protein
MVIDTESWGEVSRGTCIRCGSTNVNHLYLGMPNPDVAIGAPDWMLWSCVAGPEDRHCEDCDLGWCSPGTLQGFRNVWEVLTYYEVENLNQLGDWFTDRSDPGVWFDFITEQFGSDLQEALVPVIDGHGRHLPFPFSAQDLWDTVNELEDEMTERLYREEAELEAELEAEEGRGRGVAGVEE